MNDRERSRARVPSDCRSDIRYEGRIDRVVKVIITHEAWTEGLSLRVKAVEDEEKKEVGR